MNGHCWYQQEKNPGEVLDKLIDISASKGWLNKKFRIRCQDRRYWISCNEDSFFAYQINENCGLSPGVPGWTVCIIEKDYVYDGSGILDPHPQA